MKHLQSWFPTSRLVATGVGAVLLFAALMKGVPLLDSAVTPGAIPDDWWLSLAAAAVELFLGVWLLFGVFPRVGRFLALVTFAGLAGVASLKAAYGETSCGCLGPLHVNPSYMAAFDLFVILAICSVGGGG